MVSAACSWQYSFVQVLPQYFINAAFCLYKAKLALLDLWAACTAAAVVVLTPAHVVRAFPFFEVPIISLSQ
jgi:hypothetical protein